MFPLLPLLPSACLLGGTASASALAVTLYDRSLWKKRWLATLLSALFLPAALGLAAWAFGSLHVKGLGVTGVWTSLPILVPAAVVALSMSGLRRAYLGLRKRGARAARSANAGARREFLRRAAILAPAGAGLLGGVGLSRNERTQVVPVPLAYPDLPADFARISHPAAQRSAPRRRPHCPGSEAAAR
ncbi:MAG: hypothetical protein QM756_38930 [Polyangiaceae bacterium]